MKDVKGRRVQQLLLGVKVAFFVLVLLSAFGVIQPRQMAFVFMGGSFLVDGIEAITRPKGASTWTRVYGVVLLVIALIGLCILPLRIFGIL